MSIASLRVQTYEEVEGVFGATAVECLLRPVHLLISSPCFLFCAALTAMLFRHPDVQFYEIDRVAFGVLVIGVIARAVVLREPFFFVARASWPMAGLALLTLVSVAKQSFDHETWSLLASKIIVPFTLFHLAGLVFTDERRFRYLERFAIVVLAYLTFTAIAFLVGAHWLIVPNFILDESIGFHADRARGPLLQAVANGVSLNILGLLAFHAYRRGSVSRFKAGLLLAALPVAILATMTRAIWLSFSGTVLVLIIGSKNRAWRTRACVAATVLVAMSIVMIANSDGLSGTLKNRFEESGPVEFRKAVYAGSCEMFWDHPLMGWGFHRMPGELPKYVSGYNAQVLYPHNTYLEILVEHGVLGFAFYLWLIWEFWRLGQGTIPRIEETGFLGQDFHRMWPILLAVYWVNAAAVVMSYQFVNALVFTVAGSLAAQQRRAETGVSC